MFVGHKLIDENTFVVVMSNGDEITYKTNKKVTDYDVFCLLFAHNELEYRNGKLEKLYADKRNLKISLLQIKKDLYMKKKLQKNISDTKNDIDRLHGRISNLESEIKPLVVSVEPRKLTKKISK